MNAKAPGFSMVPTSVIDDPVMWDPRVGWLYVVLLRFAGSRGEAFPSRRRLAEMIGYKKTSAVDKPLRVLVEAGYVRRVARFKDAEGNISPVRDDRFREQTSNGYEIVPVGERVVSTTKGVVPTEGLPSPQGGATPSPHRGPGSPHTGTGVVPHRGHEIYTPEIDTPEEDKDLTPPTPSRSQSSTQLALVVDQPPVGRHTPKPSRYPDDFETWWATYPKRKSKADAHKAWKTALKHATAHELTTAARRAAHTWAAEGRDPQYIPFPATWLRGQRWLDEPDQPTTSGAAGFMTLMYEHQERTHVHQLR